MTDAATPKDPSISASGWDLSPLSETERLAAAESLTEEERRVLLHQGTEPPFCGGLLAEKRPGVFTCKLCELPLFRSDSKFDSGTGWPSFNQPFDKDHIRHVRDTSHGMIRTETAVSVAMPIWATYSTTDRRPRVCATA